jgi:hypothetical protein
VAAEPTRNAARNAAASPRTNPVTNAIPFVRPRLLVRTARVETIAIGLAAATSAKRRIRHAVSPTSADR